jgi:dTDP-4-dehydrorhamnose 3,5-epimerase
MRILTTPIAGCQVIQMDRQPDFRGSFVELFNERRYQQSGLAWPWQQLNCSHSRKNVVRGIHIVPFAKLVTCVKGRVFDVVVDMRPASATYLRWVGEYLSEENAGQVHVPSHCGHAFMAMEPDSIVIYAQDAEYDPAVETSVHWRDETIGITWPDADEYIVSSKDQVAPKVQGLVGVRG